MNEPSGDSEIVVQLGKLITEKSTLVRVADGMRQLLRRKELEIAAVDAQLGHFAERSKSRQSNPANGFEK